MLFVDFESYVRVEVTMDSLTVSPFWSDRSSGATASNERHPAAGPSVVLSLDISLVDIATSTKNHRRQLYLDPPRSILESYGGFRLYRCHVDHGHCGTTYPLRCSLG